jgi:hypothetical protein
MSKVTWIKRYVMKCGWTMGALYILLSTTAWTIAFQVPVFRYALERWNADKYEIIVLHDKPLESEDQANLAKLREAVDESTNAVVQMSAISESKEPVQAALWAKHAPQGRPIMAVLYPRGNQEIPDRLLTVAPFDAATVNVLVDSPIRREIVKRLVGGQSAVWIFVPCGNAEKDDAALKTLTEQLTRCHTKLKLPPIEEADVASAAAQEQIDQLRIEFSTVILKRDDLAERYLMTMLLRSESDLVASEEPLAFPVFGRGRVLYALVGKGINDDMILNACQFMVGPCSCQVKAQNPGFDLLTKLNWELAVGDVRISDPLPESPAAQVPLKIPPGRKSKSRD